MEDTFLYRQIAESIRRQILSGELEPGARLLPVREMAERWNCTIGTIQRAYQELSRQGLVTSRAGQGTHVVDRLPVQDETPLRRAGLIHRAESFLLEVLGAGYSPQDVEEAFRLALDRWRVVKDEAHAPAAEELRFCGSHDPAVAWLAAHFSEIAPGYTLQLGFAGSLGGLIALTEGKAEIAGCHLWDVESDTYNIPFVRRLLPGERIALITLAERRLGLMVPPGNPDHIQDLSDLSRPDLRFANRQPGSGTRVWLDAMLRRKGIPTGDIQGYANEKMTHFDVARAVAEGQAGVGLGLEYAARTYGLDFILLARERYDLAVPAAIMELPPVQALHQWLCGNEGKAVIGSLAGYETGETGKLVWVE